MDFKPSCFIQLLQIAFIVLRLCEIIDWRWIWVLSPFWIYVMIVVAVHNILGR